MAEHRIGRDTAHYKWDNALPPALTINPGDVVHCETEEVSGGQLRPNSPASALAGLNFDRLYPLAGPVFATAFGPDLMTNAKNAVRELIFWLGHEHGLSANDAYILCSLAADLKISQIVDQPNWSVSAYLPLTVVGK